MRGRSAGEELLLQSDNEPRLETLLSEFVIVDEAVLKSDLAGEVVRDIVRIGDRGDGGCGT